MTAKQIIITVLVLGLGFLLFGSQIIEPIEVKVHQVENGNNATSTGVMHDGEPMGSADTSSTDDIEYAPDFDLNKLGGGSIKLSDYRGEKPVILDFFATWCGNCQRSMPVLNSYYENYMDDIEVIGVNLQESESTVATYIAKKDISFPVVFDPSSLARSRFAVPGTNYHVFINKDGSLHSFVPGDVTESQVLQLIEDNQ